MRRPWANPSDPAGKRLAGGSLRVMRRRVHAEQDGLCAECVRRGELGLAEELDHVIPLSRGGSNARSNFEYLCKRHHDEKTDREAGRRPRRMHSNEVDVDGFPVDPRHPFFRRGP